MVKRYCLSGKLSVSLDTLSIEESYEWLYIGIALSTIDTLGIEESCEWWCKGIALVEKFLLSLTLWLCRNHVNGGAKVLP